MPGAIQCKAISKMEGPPLWAMERSNLLITSGQGYTYIFPQDADSPIWVPDQLISHVSAPRIPNSPAAEMPKKEETSSASAPSASTGNAADMETTDVRNPR